MDEIAILEYCCGELAERADDDRQLAWFWEIRLKVAKFSLAMLRRYSDLPECVQPELTPSQRSFLQSTHPLLQPQQPPPTFYRPDPEWIEDLRQRTEAYVKSVCGIRRN